MQETITKKQRTDTLKHYRDEFYRNKRLYETNQANMNRDQIILESLLLNIEEDVLFRSCEEISMEEVLESTERRFLDNLDCCGSRFATFNSFIRHKTHAHTSEKTMCVVHSDTHSTHSDTESVVSTIDTNTLNGVQERHRRYHCDIEGCSKAYTSAYGLRYHIENGHVQRDDSDKPHICSFNNCGKRYKNSNGLKYHLEHFHSK